MNDQTKRHFGKFRGVAVDVADPLALGRVRVQVPDIGGAEILGWAMPCAPVAGPHAGMIALPPVGASVWVEFERGDPDYPIWVGGFWSSPADMPATGISSADFSLAVVTPQGATFLIGDAPGPAGGIALRSGGASLIVNETGIHIQNGKGASITLVGPVVSVNNGALEVI
ncbi:phage baseplate assembly protein V [Sphingomonas colocasiae]|uniref:Phage baseplate assembly protein V n=1 Tax=Sphingomonas colocasiae TaxID=1848973 RepID=A0ABS7PK24_9SPHN|nr:phage baseplate assembly protein V [Sphingomonas colocasiae]MBY8821608.1 phage baseplate assembly protein V [Sphingomonas colocasiae]